MKKDILAGAFLLLMLAIIAVGCGQESVTVDSTAKAAATVIPAIIDSVSSATPSALYHVTAAGLMVIGAFVIAFKGKATGLVLISCGAFIGMYGETLVTSPWLSTLTTMLVAVIAAIIAYDRFRKENVLTTLTTVVQNKEEGSAIKEGITELGIQAAQAVKTVVDPIKRKLKAEGKI